VDYKPDTNHNGNPPTNITTHNGTNHFNDNTSWKETNINNKNEEIKKCILSLKIQAHSDSNRSINLTPDLEPLWKVIMLQHTALENHIKDLGSTCLKFTTMIEQKKESASKLTTDKRIPRSLRIKCELTNSPSCEDNPDYIILKRELQEAVNTFINTGLTVMKKWSRINIKLLTQDRCHNIMLKALNILEGIYTYWENIMEPINWPQNIQEYPILLLTKLYFNTDVNSDVNNIIDYLELSPPDILLIIAKIITRNKDNNFNTNRINSIDLTELQNLMENQLTVVRETLTTFDEILKATTITLWGTNISKIRHSEALQKLKAKLEADRIASATIATSMAIDKAIANIEENTSTNNVTQLRIANLEKQLLQQTQTNKEILHHLKLRSNQQKSLKRMKQKFPFNSHQDNTVDLTDSLSQSPDNTPTTTNKKPRHDIQWDSTLHQVKQYHPDTTPIQSFAPMNTPNPFKGHTFPPAFTLTALNDNTSNSRLLNTHSTLNTSSLFLGLPSTPTTLNAPLSGQTNFHPGTLPSPINQIQLQTNNKFHTSTTPNPFNNPQTNQTKKFRGGNHRGGRRRFLRRN
jgi:hypothetical protein